MAAETYDYVVVGAGSAGCVLANRLSRDPEVSVLLLEAGGHAPAWDWRVHMPAALSYPMNSTTYNWDYLTEPQPNLGGRRMHTPRGRVLGGSSAINGMAYVRGHPLDYDRWAQDPALAHWSYSHCLPYFRRAETRDLGADDYHGGDGPLYVTTGRGWSPLYDAFVKAGQEAGYPYTADMNGYRQEGFGPMQMTVREGVRWSTWKGYLQPILGRENLDVYTRAFSERISFDGDRANGIVFSHKGRQRLARASRRVILAGGPINSPQLLMLSGIGPADHLREHGIDVRADLPGVGSNLQDHLDVMTLTRCSQPVTYDHLNELMVGLKYYLYREGIGTSNIAEAGGFLASGLSDGSRPDDARRQIEELADDLPGPGHRPRLEPAAEHEGEEVRLLAWVKNVRSSGKILFAILRDGTGEVQGVVARDEVDGESWERARELSYETSVEVTGRVKADERAPSGVELSVRSVDVVGRSEDYPIQPKEHGIDFLLEHRHLWLRHPRQRAILRVRSEVVRAIRDFLHDRGFVLIDTPILTGSIGEEAGTLFETEYFDEGTAYLAQTGQLYVEAAAAAHGRVYCFGPTFRAEKSKSPQHLTEFWMVEPEVAWLDSEGNMALQEEFGVPVKLVGTGEGVEDMDEFDSEAFVEAIFEE